MDVEGSEIQSSDEDIGHSNLPSNKDAQEDTSSYKTDPWRQLQTITTFTSAERRENSHHVVTESLEVNINNDNINCNVQHIYTSSNKISHSQMMNMGRQNLTETEFQEMFQCKNGKHCSSYNSISESCDSSNKNRKFRNNGRQRHVKMKNGSHSEDLSIRNESINGVQSSVECKYEATSEGGGDCRQENIGAVAQAPVQTLTRFSPTSLLVESLIDQLCKLMEKDPTKQKQLYHVICNKLHQMQLIDETYNIEEFQFMRSHYQRALYQLLAVAKSSTHAADERSILLPLPSSNVNLDTKLNTEEVLEWSRYRHEYQELEYIAKGGFGHVYKARNKLDGGLYAIKKIFLRYRYVEGFLRSIKEVKMLARLNHPNIVSYKAAWLEPLDDKKSKSQQTSSTSTSDDASVSIYSLSSRLPLPSASHRTTGDSSDIVFQDTSPESGTKTSKSPRHESSSGEIFEPEVNSKKSRIRLLSEILETNCSAFETGTNGSHSLSEQTLPMDNEETESDTSSGSTSGAALCPVENGRRESNWRTVNEPYILRNRATLYVQMHLCERTLRQWLDERNESLPACPLTPNSSEGKSAITLFRKVVRGIDYIHSQGIVHHDIKPSNIFVNENLMEVQVGDFGLSCCLLSMVDPTGLVGDHHGEVGTRMYAAPEQLRGKCTPKSDIFSLGIVLLELLQPFHTDMERSKVIEKLRRGCLPTELTTTWPHAARLMSELLEGSANARPTANELLEKVNSLLQKSEGDMGTIIASKNETIRLLQEAVASRDQEIVELKRRLSLFEKVGPESSSASNNTSSS